VEHIVAWTSKYYLPRHRRSFEPTFLELRGIL
jgi:hypothetical protein